MTSFIMRRAEALAECQQTMTKVYGEWTKEKAAEWRPKPYADNKVRLWDGSAWQPCCVRS